MTGLALPLRFALVGGITAALYALAFAGLAELGVSTGAASVLAYLAAILFQFTGHRGFTFRAGGPILAMAGRFVVANGAGLVFATLLAVWLRDGLGLDALLAGTIVSLALALLNWVVMRLWVFR